MGKTETIQSNGCLLTSYAMILNALGKQIDNKTVTPKSLNQWLQKNSAYGQGGKIKFSPLSKLGLKRVNLSKQVNKSEIRKYVCSERSVILRLKHGHVLAVGVDADEKTFIVNDPSRSAKNKVDESEVLYSLVFN